MSYLFLVLFLIQTTLAPLSIYNDSSQQYLTFHKPTSLTLEVFQNNVGPMLSIENNLGHINSSVCIPQYLLEVGSNPKKTQSEVGRNPNYSQTQLEVGNNPNNSQTIINVNQSSAKIWYISMFINGLDFMLRFIEEFAIKVIVEFYVRFILLSALSSSFDLHYYLKQIKALSLRLQRFCIARHDYVVYIQRIFCQAPVLVVYTYALMIYPIQLWLFLHTLQMGFFVGSLFIYNMETITFWYNYEVPNSNLYLARTGLEYSFYNHLHTISHWYGCKCHWRHDSSLVGGGKTKMVFKRESVEPFFHTSAPHASEETTTFKYIDHLPNAELPNVILLKNKFTCMLPLEMLRGHLSVKQALHIAKLHGITKLTRKPLHEIEQLLADHICIGSCKENFTVLEDTGLILTESDRRKERYLNLKERKSNFVNSTVTESGLDTETNILNKNPVVEANNPLGLDVKANILNKNLNVESNNQLGLNVKANTKNQDVEANTQMRPDVKVNKNVHAKKANKHIIQNKKTLKVDINNKQFPPTLPSERPLHQFPPKPPSERLLHKILTGFIADTSPSNFIEAGCASCGQLIPIKQLTPIKSLKSSLELLRSQDNGITRLERKTVNDPIDEIQGPVIAQNCKGICHTCCKFLKKGKTPPLSLANGLWLGEVPLELRNLTYVEQLLISRVRHNRCIVKVASGRYKMRANAISFTNPVPKIYDMLPPSISELDEVLACIFTGPCQPTKADIERTPWLVPRNRVADALNWLKLNHYDYVDLVISKENLLQYPEHDAPVVIDYRKSVINKDKEATSVHDNEVEEGVEEGQCSFVVQGLTGDEYSTMSLDAIKARALEHLMNDGKIMFVGHSKDPLTIFKNPRMFPSMFPWLFPYGLGGLAQPRLSGKLSSSAHKWFLLMYYDKRFQTDPNFPLIAFNHEQIQQSSTGSFLTAEKYFFSDVTDRLLNIDMAVLSDINRRLTAGEHVKPETDEEKACYQLIGDLDAVGGHVSGSLAKKKHMQNEVWSLISYIGAPSWFITLSPADNKHPICLYYADDDVEFKPDLRLPDEAYRLIAKNPVAAARFFHFICENVIKHVFGVGQNHAGLYGETEAHYGVVEQQGRLTLHLHCILWIKGSPSPQEIRDKIMDKSSDFQKSIVEYLEAVHQGEMFEGSLEDVKTRVKDETANNPNYLDPTQTMPKAPPQFCGDKYCTNCETCANVEQWWKEFRRTTDDLLSRSNYHTCNTSTEDKNGRTLKKGCLNSKGECKARFP